ncbi:MAG: MarC family protein [Synechococcus sp.]|nr:MarC family protein [Synechococcus sp.]
MEPTTFQHYLIGLLAIGNNVSALGVFLAHTHGLPPTKVKRMILITSGSCFAMLALFMLAGTAVLDFFGISISSFQIAGGLLLAGVGWDMMKSRQNSDLNIKAIDLKDGAQSGSDAQLYASAVVPIAIPLTVGAGTFSAVILFANLATQATSRLHLLAAIFALVIVNYTVFSFSARIIRFAGEAGLSIFTKIMGLFTLAIGIEFILRGLGTVYRQLH